MEINCGSVNLTTLKQSLLSCTGAEAALTASLVSVLAEAQLVVSVFTQERMKMLVQCMLSPSKPQDVDDDNDDDDDAYEEENGNTVDGNKISDQNGPGEVEENGEEEDEEDEQGLGENPNDDEDDDDDDEDDDGDDEEDPDVDDDEEDPDDDDEEDEEDDEEAEQPLKKRKK